jgi:hypothetical protein
MSQQFPQNQPQPQPQPPYGGFVAQPPKQKKPFFKRTWVLVTGAIVGVFIVIGAVNGGGDTTAATSADSPATSAPVAPKAKASAKPSVPASEAPATTQAPAPVEEVKCTGNRNDPCTVKLGVAFTVGKHTMSRGWKLKTQEYLGTQIVGTLAMTSDDTDPSTAFFTVKFLKGSQVVANFQCSSSELEKGQTEEIECHNMSDVSKPLKAGSYNKITAEADF